LNMMIYDQKEKIQILVNQRFSFSRNTEKLMVEIKGLDESIDILEAENKTLRKRLKETNFDYSRLQSLKQEISNYKTSSTELMSETQLIKEQLQLRSKFGKIREGALESDLGKLISYKEWLANALAFQEELVVEEIHDHLELRELYFNSLVTSEIIKREKEAGLPIPVNFTLLFKETTNDESKWRKWINDKFNELDE